MTNSKTWLDSEAKTLMNIANYFNENYDNPPFDVDDVIDIYEKYKAMSQIEDELYSLIEKQRDKIEHFQATNEQEKVSAIRDFLKETENLKELIIRLY